MRKSVAGIAVRSALQSAFRFSGFPFNGNYRLQTTDYTVITTLLSSRPTFHELQLHGRGKVRDVYVVGDTC